MSLANDYKYLTIVFRCLGKLVVESGEELYKMDRNELRDICGIREGTTLYSLLQRDRAQVKANNVRMIPLSCHFEYRLLRRLVLLTIRVNSR